MPRFYEQNKRRIDPRYFLEETIERSEDDSEVLEEKKKKKKKAVVKKKKSFPDLTGDGKVTRADILKGRGVIEEEGAEEALNDALEEALEEEDDSSTQTIDEKRKKKRKKRKKKPCKPAKGKRFAKRVNGKCRSFGQKGKAKDGGDRIRPGTKKGDAYCARSLKIKKCKNPPCANALSRKKWKCRGAKSMAEGEEC